MQTLKEPLIVFIFAKVASNQPCLVYLGVIKVYKLGLSWAKLGLDFNQILYIFGVSIFDLVELVGYIFGLTEKIWFGTFWFSKFCSD